MLHWPLKSLTLIVILLSPCYVAFYLCYRLYRFGRFLLRRPLKALPFMLNSLLIVAIIGTLAAIAIPPNLQPTGRPRSSRAASDTKLAVQQAIVYAKDKSVYPTSLKMMRDSGYANLPDEDPWGVPYRLSLVLTRGRTPKPGDNVFIYSKGPQGTGTYPHPFTDLKSARGSIGYSSIYGEWRGE